MNRYKIVGILNFLFGIFGSCYSLFSIFVLIPKLNSVYQEFGAKIDPVTIYLFPSVILLLGIFSMFVAWKLIREKQQKYFILGIIALVLDIILLGLLVRASVLSVLLPIYNLTSQFPS